MIVTVLAFVNLQVLLTIFFTWASIHVLHQITYINDCYAAKRPVRVAEGPDHRLRRGLHVPVPDGHACRSSTTTSSSAASELYVPGWADYGIVPDLQVFAAFALFGIFFVLWIGKNLREARQGMLNVPSVLLIGLTIVIGFTLPLFPNIDVAFQGFNTWHSFQYLALIWFLNTMRKQRVRSTTTS